MTGFDRAFSIWWDRWNGHGWCWRENSGSPYRSGPSDKTQGQGYISNRQARSAIRSEIDRRRMLAPAPQGP